MDNLNEILQRIERIQGEDPNRTPVDDQLVPDELLYGRRMMEMLHQYEEVPTPLLQIAAKGQHIRRWEIPRTDYPMDRQGYLRWRTRLKLLHGELLTKIMKESGYGEKEAREVGDLVTKKKLKTDPQTQKLEDVICLVFLKYYLGRFARQQPRDKMIDIIQKTWAKMTEKGHKIALAMALPAYEAALVREALD